MLACPNCRRESLRQNAARAWCNRCGWFNESADPDRVARPAACYCCVARPAATAGGLCEVCEAERAVMWEEAAED